MIDEAKKESGLKHFFTHWTWKKVLLWLLIAALIRVIFIAISSQAPEYVPLPPSPFEGG